MKTLAILCFVFLVEVYSNDKEEFLQWFNYVKNPLTECRPTANDSIEGLIPLLQFVNCDQEGAIFRYKVTSSSGKMSKSNKPFNGFTKLTFAHHNENEKYNFGLRTGKCILLSKSSIRKEP